MEEPLIRDIPTIKKNLELVRGMKSLKAIMPLLKPVLRLLGLKVDGVSDALSQVPELERMAEDLATIPDRFNDIFAERGWIIYDMMNVEIAKAAIAKAEGGDIDGAEADLVDYYNAETVKWNLQTMYGVRAFHPRMPLAQKALTDYCEGRYHACVPVVLALLDGMVSELHEKRRGFFAEEVDLQAWDSIAAHSKGLNVLVSIFQKGRKMTRVEPIFLPYRHGIIHGMDLGYDNKVVAAKAWAALFATRDWALKAERGMLEEPPEEPKKSWAEIFREHGQSIRENAEDRTRLEAWKRREIRIGEDVPTTAGPDAFTADTPERKLVEYLDYWRSRNYGGMAQCLPATQRNPISKAAGQVRSVYGSRSLERFELQEIDDQAAAVTEIKVRVWYNEGSQVLQQDHTFRLINEDTKGSPAVRGKPNSCWTIYTWGIP